MAGLVLVATAAFGGLATAPPPAVDQLAVGEIHTNDEISLSVERATLVDSLDEYAFPLDPGNQLLVLVVTVTNRTDQPLPTSGGGVFGADGINDNLSIDIRDELDESTIEFGSDKVVATMRTDDGINGPRLQPGVPVRVAVIWSVEPGIAERIIGGELEVTIYDLSFGNHSLVSDVDTWGDPIPAAQVSIAPEAAGAISITVLDAS